MRQYQVNIPVDVSELPGLVGKVVKYTGDMYMLRDLLLFNVDDEQIELIEQGRIWDTPSSPNYKVDSRTVKLKDLIYAYNGLEAKINVTNIEQRSFPKEEKKTTYSQSDKGYQERQEALSASRLWVEPQDK